MNDDLLNMYRKIMSELLILREAEGGDLPVELESSYVERLDNVWWRLSDEEHEQFEAELASATPPVGPEDLNLVDCEVDKGARSTPRRAA